MKERNFFIDSSLFLEIAKINIPNMILLLIVSFLFFLALPRWLFPQKHTGVGLEKTLSNIMYMLVYIELVIPLLVYSKIFTIAVFLSILGVTKIVFLKLTHREPLRDIFLSWWHNFVVSILDKVEHPPKMGRFSVDRVFYRFFFKKSYWQALIRLVIVICVLYILYVSCYRCFFSLSNALPDTGQFIEWVANLNKNILWSDTKLFGADFYGLSIFVFLLYKLSNIDPVILFNIYPLLLFCFLFFTLYFVVKRWTFSSSIALMTLIFYVTLLTSPWSSYIISSIIKTAAPEVIHLFGMRFYDIPDSLQSESYDINYISYVRYFSGMAYEFASPFVLINLYYLVRGLKRYRPRYFINYTLSMLLVFVFHGGGAVFLAVSSILIFVNVLVFGQLKWETLKKGIVAIAVAFIFGNLWLLSIFKYGIPENFGAAAPFLDYILNTKHAQDYVRSGFEKVMISDLSLRHFIVFVMLPGILIFFSLLHRRFFVMNILLVCVGFFLVYFSPNLGLGLLVKQKRAVEYLYMGLSILFACYARLLYNFLTIFFKRVVRGLFYVGFFVMLFISAVIPKFYNDIDFLRYTNFIQYSDTAYFLLKIIQQNRANEWTVVSYVQEYPKVLGRGFMINTNEFLLKYNPQDSHLAIPTPKVYIFVENIPHKYLGQKEWYYRWRGELALRLKEWVMLYGVLHDNIKVFGQSKLLTVYEIDNQKYMRKLQEPSEESF